MKPKKILLPFFVILFVAAIAIGLTAYDRQKSSASTNTSANNLASKDRISVTTSFYPLAFFAERVGGDKINVKNLTPSGVEPHDFEPPTRDIETIYRSKVFIYNGAGMDPWAEKIKPEAKKQGVEVLPIADNFSLLKILEDDHADEKKDIQTETGAPKDDHSQEFDPHLWINPVNARKYAELTRDILIKVDTPNKSTYEANASNLILELNKLDQQFRQGLQECRFQEVVISHNFLQYLAFEYGFKTEPISGLSPDSEPSSQQLSDIVKFIKNKNIRYIFTETLSSPTLSVTISKETGGEVLILNPLEGLTKEESNQGKNYLTIQKENLSNLRKAMECK